MTRAAAAVAMSLSLCLAACGYRAVYGGEGDGTERFHVALVRSLVPDAAATDEVVAGVRERLAREGALRDGDGYPRIEIEVLRADELSEGVVARGSQPQARAVLRGLTVRGWLKRSETAPPERDTGDLRALDLIAVDRRAADGALDPTAALLSASDTSRATARRLGHRIALRVLGFPVPPDESGGPPR